MKKLFVVVLAALLCLVGASEARTKAKRKVAPVKVAEIGPDRPLALGKVARLFLTLDPATGELTGRILALDSEEHLRIVQDGVRVTGTVEGKKFVVVMAPVEDAATGEKKWDASTFRGQSAELMGAEKFAGNLFFIRVKGVNFHRVNFVYRTASEAVAETPVP